MKNNEVKIAFGIGLIFLGCIFLVDSFNIADINIPGEWWALIILIPCVIGLVKRRGNRLLCIIGTAVSSGIIFSGYFNHISIVPLIIAIIIILVGIKAIWPDFFKEKLSYKEPGTREFSGNNKENSETGKVNLDKNAYANQGDEKGESTESANHAENKGGFSKDVFSKGRSIFGGTNDIVAIFSGKDLKMDGDFGDKLNLSAVFGGIDVDFRHANIKHDITLNCDAVFGGISIYAPENVKIKQNVSSIFGGVENTVPTPEDANENTPTIFVNGACIFGGIEIK
ncbi:MAG: cell wall-active antibiotics response protein [Lachnospiraceae bacterium]|nr:cell wall-active antibiotics response protein [Lachnospiraceae bacterium]